MQTEIDLCVELNYVLTECKIELGQHHPLQRKIDAVMLKYQSYFGDIYTKATTKKLTELMAEYDKLQVGN